MVRGDWKGIETKAERRSAMSGEQGDGQTESHIAETPADMGANGSEAELGQRETHRHPPQIGLSLRELWGREQGVHTQVRTHRAGRERAGKGSWGEMGYRQDEFWDSCPDGEPVRWKKVFPKCDLFYKLTCVFFCSTPTDYQKERTPVLEYFQKKFSSTLPTSASLCRCR